MDEELEEGEVSDEDEESRKERLKPQPVCRFYSKGQCTWGASCRFVHPGVLDKGNYNMFAPPRPILPNEDSIDKLVEEDQEAGGTETASASATKPSPEVARRPETGNKKAKKTNSVAYADWSSLENIFLVNGSEFRKINGWRFDIRGP